MLTSKTRCVKRSISPGEAARLVGVTVTKLTIGDVAVTRVGYVDVSIPPARVGLSVEQIASVEWAEPVWAGGGEIRAGAAAWVIESGDARIVVDPACAADDILRTDADAAAHQEAFAALLADAGFPRESFTHAIATHYEGVGMFAWRNDDGSWTRFFPNAPILMSQTELDAMDAGRLFGEAIMPQLREQGALGAVHGDRVDITGDVALELTGGHSPGHQIVRVHSGGEQAVIVGHLAVSAVHLGTGYCPEEHMDPGRALEVMEKLLTENAILIGPLWPEPGAGRMVEGRFVPVSA
jgi:glyoxylase-like metal-dependent hydrolase (beta-lactamase superfamily II)